LTRDLTAELATEFEASSIIPILIVEFEFDSETLRMWSGYGTLTWNGNDYIGAGNLATISTLQESQNLEAKGIVFTLSGIPETMISLAFNERTRGRPCRLWLGAIDTTGDAGDLELGGGGGGFLLLAGGGRLKLHGGTVIPNTLINDPYRCFTGLMDVMEISDDGENALIRLSVESSLLTGQRAKIQRYTSEDQKNVYDADKGLDLINQLIDKEVVW